MRTSAKIGLSIVLTASLFAIGCTNAPEGEIVDGVPSAETAEASGGSVQQVLESDQDVYEAVVKDGTPAKLGDDGKGGLLVDATGTAVILDVPSAPLSFATGKDFAGYAAKYKAKPIFDKNGNVVGIEGAVTQLGNVVTLDHKNKKANLVADPIASLLGGTAGYVTVGKQLVCLTEECAKQNQQLAPATGTTKPLGSRTVCRGSLCLSIGSFNTNILNYKNFGGFTDVSGGFLPILCAWFGWFCPAGADELMVRPTYIKNDGARWGTHEARRAGAAHVEQSRWAVDFGFFAIGDGDIRSTSGVCTEHFGRRGNDVISGEFTSEGNTRGQCPQAR